MNLESRSPGRLKATLAEWLRGKSSATNLVPAAGTFLVAGLLGLAAMQLGPAATPGPLATWPGLLALGGPVTGDLGFSLLGGATELAGFVVSAAIIAAGLFWKDDGTQETPTGQEAPPGQEVSAGAELGAEGQSQPASPNGGLARSASSSRILGVCGGLGEHLGIDPVLVRVAFMAGTVVSGIPLVVAYFGLAYAMPKEQPSVA